MSADTGPTVAVVGAGCIGAWVGARLAATGTRVRLVTRPGPRAAALAAAPLRATTLAGHRAETTAATVHDSPAACAGADAVLLAVKGAATTAAAAGLAPHLAPGTPVLSLQNGLRNPARIAAALPAADVVPGMVSFNVVWTTGADGGADLRQTTSGPVVLGDRAPAAVVQAFVRAGIPTLCHPDMPRVQWAKLLLNLNNAVNALSGRPLRDQLSDRGYRRVLAAAMGEAWSALDAAGIRPQPVGRMRPRLAPRILPLPDLVFRILAAPMIRIDPQARSSMADDLDRGRPTEIDDINGEVVALGQRVGVATPVNAHLVGLVHAAAQQGRRPRLAPAALWP